MDTEIARKLRPSLRVSAARFTPISTFHEPARTAVQGAFDRAKKSLAEEFTGITTGGAPVEGLFPVMRTGVSVEPVVEAAHAFKDTLTKEQCEQFFRKVRWSQGHHNKLFSEHERIDVLYEEMAGEPQSIFGKLQQFLGVEARTLSYSQQPLNVAPMRELLANYDELREAFRDTQYAWMFN